MIIDERIVNADGSMIVIERFTDAEGQEYMQSWIAPSGWTEVQIAGRIAEHDAALLAAIDGDL